MGVALGIGRGKQFRIRRDLYSTPSNDAASVFAAAGFTTLSKVCERALIIQTYDPEQWYYKWSLIQEGLFDAEGYTGLSIDCGIVLVQQINGGDFDNVDYYYRYTTAIDDFTAEGYTQLNNSCTYKLITYIFP